MNTEVVSLLRVHNILKWSTPSFKIQIYAFYMFLSKKIRVNMFEI